MLGEQLGKEPTNIVAEIIPVVLRPVHEVILPLLSAVDIQDMSKAVPELRLERLNQGFDRTNILEYRILLRHRVLLVQVVT